MFFCSSYVQILHRFRDSQIDSRQFYICALTLSCGSIKSFNVVLLDCNEPLLSAMRCSWKTRCSRLCVLSFDIVRSLLLVSIELALGLLEFVPLTKKMTTSTAVKIEITAIETKTTTAIWVCISLQGIPLQLCVCSVVLQDSHVLFLIRIPSSHVLEHVLHADHSTE